LAVAALAVAVPAQASIDSLWTSPSTTGIKGSLYAPGSSRVDYLYALDSVAGVCRIYDPDNFTQLYSFPISPLSIFYPYFWPQYLNDVDGNGHPEVIIYIYNTSSLRYSVGIFDMFTGTAVKSWSGGGYSYFPKFLASTPGSNMLRLGIEKTNGATGTYPSTLMIYSLGVTGVASAPGGARNPGISLEQSYPNPLNDRAIIEFDLPKPGQAKVTVYNQLGQEVRVLADREFSAGHHAISFDGRGLPNGAYFYRLSTSDGVDAKKLLLVK